MRFELDIRDFNVWMAGARRFTRALPDVADQAEWEAADLVAGRTRQRVPSVTGATRRSIRVLDYQGDATVVAGGPSAPQFGWLNYGGRSGRDLANVRQKVSRGRYMFPAYDDSIADIEEIMNDNAAEALRRYGLA